MLHRKPSFIRPSVVALAIALLCALVASPASAFCRKTTAGGDEAYDATITGACAGGPKALPLYWGQRCVAVAVVVEPALEAANKMTAARASAIVSRATSDWAAVACPSAAGPAQPLAIRVVDASRERCPDGATATRSELRFSADPVEDGLLAVTDVTYDGLDGAVSAAKTRVLDVYGDPAKTTPDAIDAIVAKIVRHEMGHFLGLAHSNDAHAVMYAGYDPQRTDGLTPDDVAGICDAYAPDKPIGAGCAVTDRRGDSGADAGALVGLAVLVLVRRRARATIAVARCRRLASVAAIAVVGATLATTTHARADSASSASASAAKKKGATKPPAKRKTPPKPAAATSAQDDALLHVDEPTLARPTSTAPSSPSSSLALRMAATDEPRAGALASGAASPTVPAEPRDAPATAAPPTPRTYDLFVGARYRAALLPKPLLGPIARTNESLLFHSVALEAAFHRRRFAIIPALTFADLSTGDILVGASGGDLASSLSHVKSDMKAIAASVSLVWSAPVSRTVDLELGVELGAGGAFGTLTNDWVYETPNGPLALDGRRFAPCQTVNDGFGCRPQDHSSPTPIRVGGYHERGLLDGGKAPTILPWVSLPLVGLRARIGDSFAARVGLGASFTGLWAGVSLETLIARADQVR